jgi:dCMP deaminase
VNRRPTWDEYFLSIAGEVARRADCTRRKVGAVIVKDNRIRATGYNGAPAGDEGCMAGGCPRGRHRAVIANPDLAYFQVGYYACACGGPWPCDDYAAPLSSYDTGPQSCIAVHAEANALLYADRNACEGATMYVTCQPCDGCDRLIRGSGVVRVVWP